MWQTNIFEEKQKQTGKTEITGQEGDPKRKEPVFKKSTVILINVNLKLTVISKIFNKRFDARQK